MKKLYKVKTYSGITWQYIVSFTVWTLDENFIRFVCNDDTELILPKKEIISIYQP